MLRDDVTAMQVDSSILRGTLKLNSVPYIHRLHRRLPCIAGSLKQG